MKQVLCAAVQLYRASLLLLSTCLGAGLLQRSCSYES